MNTKKLQKMAFALLFAVVVGQVQLSFAAETRTPDLAGAKATEESTMGTKAMPAMQEASTQQPTVTTVPSSQATPLVAKTPEQQEAESATERLKAKAHNAVDRASQTGESMWDKLKNWWDGLWSSTSSSK